MRHAKAIGRRAIAAARLGARGVRSTEKKKVALVPTSKARRALRPTLFAAWHMVMRALNAFISASVCVGLWCVFGFLSTIHRQLKD